MAGSQYSADSVRDPDLFPRPLMLPCTSRRKGLSPVADDGDPGAWHSAGIDVSAETVPTSITLHS